MNTKLFLVFTGSLLFQIVQLGCFPILISQILDQKGESSSVIGLLIAIPWVSVLLLGPVVPVLIAGVNSTEIALQGKSPSQWIQFLTALNVVFLSVGFLLYEFLLEE